MPVSIDEITAEMEPPRTPPPVSGPQADRTPSPEVELRRQGDLRARLECRAARVRAD